MIYLTWVPHKVLLRQLQETMLPSKLIMDDSKNHNRLNNSYNLCSYSFVWTLHTSSMAVCPSHFSQMDAPHSVVPNLHLSPRVIPLNEPWLKLPHFLSTLPSNLRLSANPGSAHTDLSVIHLYKFISYVWSCQK